MTPKIAMSLADGTLRFHTKQGGLHGAGIWAYLWQPVPTAVWFPFEGPPEEEQDAKDLVANNIQILAAMTECDHLLMVTEAWALSGVPEEDAVPGVATNSPDRVSVLVGTLVTRERRYLRVVPLEDEPVSGIGDGWMGRPFGEGRFGFPLPPKGFRDFTAAQALSTMLGGAWNRPHPTA